MSEFKNYNKINNIKKQQYNSSNVYMSKINKINNNINNNNNNQGSTNGTSDHSTKNNSNKYSNVFK